MVKIIYKNSIHVSLKYKLIAQDNNIIRKSNVKIIKIIINKRLTFYNNYIDLFFSGLSTKT